MPYHVVTLKRLEPTKPPTAVDFPKKNLNLHRSAYNNSPKFRRKRMKDIGVFIRKKIIVCIDIFNFKNIAKSN